MQVRGLQRLLHLAGDGIGDLGLGGEHSDPVDIDRDGRLVCRDGGRGPLVDDKALVADPRVLHDLLYQTLAEVERPIEAHGEDFEASRQGLATQELRAQFKPGLDQRRGWHLGQREVVAEPRWHGDAVEGALDVRLPEVEVAAICRLQAGQGCGCG